MNLTDINPHIRYASIHYFHINKPFDSICYDCRLFFVKEGNGHVTTGNSEYRFSPNSTLFLPAGTQYNFHVDRNCSKFECIVINFDLINDFNYLSKSLGTDSVNNFRPDKLVSYPMPTEFASAFLRNAPAAAELLEKCCKEFLIQNPLYREISSAFLKAYLLDLVRNFDQGLDSSKITPILEYVHTNYADTTLSNETIANLFNYHPYYLSQMVRQHTGQSLHQYLISYRIRMAKKKLITTNDPISTIAWESGFQSPAYFTAQFKAKVGVTPNTYRKEHMHL